MYVLTDEVITQCIAFSCSIYCPVASVCVISVRMFSCSLLLNIPVITFFNVIVTDWCLVYVSVIFIVLL